MIKRFIPIIANDLGIEIAKKLDDVSKDKIRQKLRKNFSQNIINLNLMIDNLIMCIEDEFLDYTPLGVSSIAINIDEVIKDKIHVNDEEYFFINCLDKGLIKIEFNDRIDLLAEHYRKQTKNDMIDEVLDVLNSKYHPHTRREKNILLANSINIYSQAIKSTFQEYFKTEITENIPRENQEILNDSYTVITNEIKKIEATEALKNSFIDMIEHHQNIYNNLFLNNKKMAQIKSDNHHMAFLKKCTTVYTNYEKVVFKEFTLSFIQGFKLLSILERDKNKIKKLEKELNILKSYNQNNENDKNIFELKSEIEFLQLSKSAYKMIPFKILSSKIDVSDNQMYNFIKNSLDENTHKNTFNTHFNDIVLKEIDEPKISIF